MSSEIEGLEELLEKFDKLGDKGFRALKQGITDACLDIETKAKQNVPVKSGELRRRLESEIEESGRTITGIVGTNLEYAPYVEYGTGLFSSKGNGRRTPWSYEDEEGNWHTTTGQKPQPFLTPAYNEDKILEYLEDALKEVIAD